MTNNLKNDIAALARALYTHLNTPRESALHRGAFDRVAELAESYEPPESPTIPTIKEAVVNRLFKDGDQFEDFYGNRFRFVAYPERTLDCSVILRNTGQSGRKLIKVSGDCFCQLMSITRMVDGERVEIAKEPNPVKFTIDDFISKGFVEKGDVFWYEDDTSRQVLFCEDGLVYFPSENKLGIFRVTKEHGTGCFWIYQKEADEALWITRNGQVVAAWHFWENR